MLNSCTKLTSRIVIITLCFTLQCIGFYTNAQSKDTLKHYTSLNYSIEYADIWLQSNQPAAISYQPFNKLATINAGFLQADNLFKSVFHPTSQTQYNLSSSGYTKLNQLNLWGKAQYKNTKQSEQKWNNTTFISEANPFIHGDSIGGDYQQDFYLLEARMAYRSASKKYDWGLGLNYTVSDKTNQSDPRPLIKSLRFKLEPGLIIHQQKWDYGISLKYERLSETTETTRNDKSENHALFRFIGMGLHKKETLGTGYPEDIMTYNGYKKGISIQSKYKGLDFENLSIASYEKTYERAAQGSVGQLLTGDYHNHKYNFTNILLIKKEQLIHNIKLNISHNHIKGIWFYQKEIPQSQSYNFEIYDKAVRHKRKITQIESSYDFIIEENNLPHLQVESGIKLTFDKTEVFPESYYNQVNNIQFSSNINKYLYFGGINLKMNLAATYRFNLSKRIYIEDIELKEQITYPEYYYSSADFLQFKIGITTDLLCLAADKYMPYASLYTQQLFVTENSNNHNHNYSIGIGILF
ncbi:DUF6850 family outer membrane beta-barrel protein [Labilibacter marinus]|uniref:DUF6850 family outer membrane beta-barrel protein n=1 Tax=Labilibacter marinus TaxID=1477105 RepID=UPI00094F6F37|nr:DUF6850 family outer membrane beta-barrel protein [Labilibacter marinus]